MAVWPQEAAHFFTEKTECAASGGHTAIFQKKVTRKDQMGRGKVDTSGTNSLNDAEVISALRDQLLRW